MTLHNAYFPDRLHRRDFLLLVGGGTASLVAAEVLAGCGGGNGGTPATRVSPVLLFPNPGDTNLALVTGQDRQQIMLLGNKSASGLPLTLTDAAVEASDGDPSKRAVVSYDDHGRPRSGVLGNGMILQLEYLTALQVDLTLIAPSGKIYGPLHFNGNTGALTRVAGSAFHEALMETRAENRRPSRQALQLRRSRCVPPDDAVAGRVTVTCGASTPLDGAQVIGTYVPDKVPSGVPTGTRFALCLEPLGPTPGVFQYFVPKHPYVVGPTTGQQIADALAPLTAKPCEFYDAFGLSKIAKDDLVAILTQLGALALETSAAVLLLAALAAACSAKKALDAAGVALQIIDLFEGGGALEFRASYMGVSAGPVAGHASLDSAPSFNLTFPTTVCIDHIDMIPANPSVSVKSTVQLVATAKDKDGNSVSGAAFEWSSSDSSIATVADGTVIGVMAGSATITATERTSGKSGAVTVTVTPATIHVKFSANFYKVADAFRGVGAVRLRLDTPVGSVDIDENKTYGEVEGDIPFGSHGTYTLTRVYTRDAFGGPLEAILYVSVQRYIPWPGSAIGCDCGFSTDPHTQDGDVNTYSY